MSILVTIDKSMLEFTQWLSLKTNDENLNDAKRYLGLALVGQSSGTDILSYIDKFKESISRCSNKILFDSLIDNADEAISEEDPDKRRHLLSSLLRRLG